MKRLAAIGAFLMVSSAAQAQYTFEYGGKTIRIDPDRGTISIPGVFDNSGRRGKRPRNDQDAAKRQAPDQVKANPQAPALPPSPATSPTPAANETAPSPAANAPALSAESPPAPPAEPVQPRATAPGGAMVPEEASPAARDMAPPIAATAPSIPAPRPAEAAPASPLGLWLTEEKAGRVRIEQCGVNLCGFTVDPKSNRNTDQVLINMKPTKDSTWSGAIVDPNTGSTYDSTIALKASGTLRIQGCAFSSMFCGAQTWSRLN
jgi:uncharacterized protein (DUF2147 family)